MLKKVFLFMMTVGMTVNAWATQETFVAKEKGQIVKQIGPIAQRHSPLSTFKIPLVLMGFDSGILESKDSPRLTFSPELEKNFGSWYNPNYIFFQLWRRDHTPQTYLEYSVIWFSHYITQNLGMERFKAYVEKLSYGNRDVSGTPGKNNGLFDSWLDTSLQISPLEQAEFIECLVTNTLPLSKDAQQKTREILYKQDIWDGWKLYGKTGGGRGNQGWFVGWIEKNDRRIAFAHYLERDDTVIPMPVGRVAQELAKDHLLESILRKP